MFRLQIVAGAGSWQQRVFTKDTKPREGSERTPRETKGRNDGYDLMMYIIIRATRAIVVMRVIRVVKGTFEETKIRNYECTYTYLKIN